jgi:hypothetical protein
MVALGRGDADAPDVTQVIVNVLVNHPRQILRQALPPVAR